MNREAIDFFLKNFEFLIASRYDDYISGCSLRRNIYHDKFGYLSGDNIEDEWDVFDDKAVHFIIRHKKSQTPIGYFRIVTPVEGKGLPIQHLLENNFDDQRDPSTFPVDTICELSRFSLLTSTLYQKRGFDFLETMAERECFRHARDALWIGMGSVASLLERYHGFALIEPRFARLIKGSHVRFERVGSFQELYGQRAPYYINYHELITSLPEASLYMMEAIKARIAPKYYQEFLELSSDATFSWRNAFLSKALE